MEAGRPRKAAAVRSLPVEGGKDCATAEDTVHEEAGTGLPPAAGEEDIGLPGADSGLRAEAGIGLEVDIGRAGDTAAGAVGRTGLGPDSPGGRSYKTSTGGFASLSID